MTEITGNDSTMSDQTTTVFSEAITAARSKNPEFPFARHKKEPVQQFLQRVISVLSEIPDEVYEDFSEGLKDWYDTAIDAVNEHREIALPEGFAEEAGSAEGAEAPAPAAKRQRKAKEAALPQSEPQAAAKAEASASQPQAAEAAGTAANAANGGGEASPSEDKAAKKARRAERKAAKQASALPLTRGRRRKDFSLRTLRKRLIEEPSLTVDDLIKMGREGGQEYSVPTVNLTRRSTLAMIELIKETGHWVD